MCLAIVERELKAMEQVGARGGLGRVSGAVCLAKVERELKAMEQVGARGGSK